MAELPDSEIKSMLEAEKADALAGMNASKLSDEREQALEYYMGDMSKDMPVPTDRSKAVSTDVADTIEGLMPALMEIFASSDEAVQFEAVGPEDEEAAAQETDYVNHVLFQKNPGFMVLYAFQKDALLSKNGIVKVWWEDNEVEEEETYRGLTDIEVEVFKQNNPDVKVIEDETYIDEQADYGVMAPMQPEMPQMPMGAPLGPA
jgi:hypothetical protein